MDPAGKVALVTGGASGIGLAICSELLQNNVKGLVFCDVNKELGTQTLGELQKKYGSEKVIFVKADVRSNDELEEVFKQAKKSFGQLDIVCNNAGICNDFNWEKAVDIDLNGVIRGILLAFKYMGKHNGNTGGVVVNTASICSLEIHDIVPIYCGIKHGVMGLTRAFGTPLHYGKTGVKVIAVCPNATRTGMNNVEGMLLDDEWLTLIDPNSITLQLPECVARGILLMIRQAPNGSLWVSENGEPVYQVTIPPVSAMKV